jgi:hypothetical protein
MKGGGFELVANSQECGSSTCNDTRRLGLADEVIE